MTRNHTTLQMFMQHLLKVTTCLLKENAKKSEVLLPEVLAVAFSSAPQRTYLGCSETH